ncbi:HET-domain-containing protein [Massarina eburnea CBS 473.64]|uniref:HET-domain-containing protein n=1 Tax=Massarina eburnea CBS 473.64 TaxID=1395130 RepID=A0A6A6RUM5_9PLEO|nr:HET-domain-containing protein [Massarina eburnea CBS 473.64]
MPPDPRNVNTKDAKPSRESVIRETRDLVRSIEAAIQDAPSSQTQPWMSQAASATADDACIACPRNETANICNITSLALVFLRRTCFGCAQIFAAVHTILLDADSDDLYHHFSQIDTRVKSEGGILIRPGISLVFGSKQDYEIVRIGQEDVVGDDLETGSSGFVKHMVVEAFQDSPNLSFRRKERIAPSLWSGNALTWLRDRLDTCVREHPSCQSRDGTHLPTRILDVGREKSRIYLIDGTDVPVTRYITLSYRWGSAKNSLRTLTTNYSEHQAGIQLDTLTPMFQDVIALVRRFQVRYLWIDALCIVQDSAEDWIQESGKMSEVYANAFLTIAASACPGGTNRRLMEVDAEHYGWLIPSRTNEPVVCRREIDHTLFTTKRALMPQQHSYLLRDLPLLARGWVYQERALSPRYVHFGQEMVWECNACTECECSWSCAGDERWKLANSCSGHDGEVGRRRSRVDAWHRRVEAYTSLQLTFPQDVFPAIGGMARDFQRSFATLGSYQAGMWEHTILYNLSWCGRNLRPRDRVGQWRAPTWSWAALDGPVEFRLAEHYKIFKGEPLCEFVAVDSVPLGADAFGRLDKASITLEGFLVDVKVVWNDTDEIWNPYDGDDEPDLYLGAKKIGWAYWDCWPDPVTAEAIPPHSQVRLFLLGRSKKTFVYLLLKEVGDGVYERYGNVHLDTYVVDRELKEHAERKRVVIV